MLKAITTGDTKTVQDLIRADPKLTTAKLISHKEDLVRISRLFTSFFIYLLFRRFIEPN